MRYVKDKTGRFPERPHYEPAELDTECEKIITNFLKQKYGEIKFPIDTEDLKSLIESETQDLDCYADLTQFGSNVEGVTEFFPNQKPKVLISKTLTEDPRYENRLRTTLTHEYGHVRFHSYLFTFQQDQMTLFSKDKIERLVCKRDDIVNAAQSDWMEWQAGYVCGSILMPLTHLRNLVGNFLIQHGHHGPIESQSHRGHELINAVSKTFKVSNDAARVRLLKLNFLGTERGQSLFS